MSMPPSTSFPFDTLSNEDLDPTEQISTAWIEREVIEARAVFLEEATLDDVLEPFEDDETPTEPSAGSPNLVWFAAGVLTGLGLGAFPASLTVLALVVLG